SDSLPQTVAQHLRWIMQKDLLGQDVFLIGPPGPLRRSIAMQYLELTKREVEYVALSRDTTETDLKQRREIRSGTAFYIDQVLLISSGFMPCPTSTIQYDSTCHNICFN
ncbi:von Willebrand factor A domain-containing protein 8, partial [Xenoophorus captivus]